MATMAKAKPAIPCTNPATAAPKANIQVSIIMLYAQKHIRKSRVVETFDAHRHVQLSPGGKPEAMWSLVASDPQSRSSALYRFGRCLSKTRIDPSAGLGSSLRAV